ncbi:hypothetical protein ZWY2020_020454 [Hordeum vulgare]|nr:hypothetical protein ZWY2020_020454 [Hordeum vulgare]
MPDLGGADMSPIAVAPLPPDRGRTASSPTAAASPCQRTVMPHPVPDHGRLASRISRWSAYGDSHHRHGVVLLLPLGWPHGIEKLEANRRALQKHTCGLFDVAAKAEVALRLGEQQCAVAARLGQPVQDR